MSGDRATDSRPPSVEQAPPYRVELDHKGCAHCGSGDTYHVVGPDEIAESTSWEDREMADDFADAMNRAHAAGRAPALRVERDALKRLRAEVSGVLGIAREALIAAIGFTNVRVLELRVDEAGEALGILTPAPTDAPREG